MNCYGTTIPNAKLIDPLTLSYDECKAICNHYKVCKKCPAGWVNHFTRDYECDLGWPFDIEGVEWAGVSSEEMMWLDWIPEGVEDLHNRNSIQ